jgi:translation initiation factor IF-2
MSDTDKPKLGMRAPLGIKRTVETGKVKQSFSHGRSNTVVVEVKKRRILGRPGEEATTPEPETDIVVAAPLVAPPPPVQAPTRVETARPMTVSERREQQDRLLREAEESRMAALEETRRREERARLDASGDEKRRAEENRRAEEEARLVAEEAAKAPQEAPAPTAPITEPEVQRAQQSESERRFSRPAAAPVVRRPEPARPAARRDDHRRERGKLTVTRALDGDEGARARSLAALKRAREKERRSHMGSGPREKQVRDVIVPETITVGELANRMAERGADLVKALFKMGMPVTINASIDADTAELLVTEFGHNLTRVSASDVEIDTSTDVDNSDSMIPRAPVVTIMGHVDHGKTSLLDALRGSDIAKGEAGGITQHIGAYQVAVKGGGQVTFLDTPGHEAFSDMRARGANVTDIVVLVVAADDSIKPQTIEAISHTKAAGVPMIVAITKADKPEAKPQKVREALLQYEVVVEAMSGDVQDVEVSALKKTGLDDLIEKIQLQADLLELRANPDRAAEGTVIEAQLDKGRGPVATILVGRGTLKVGDIIVVGAESGKVRAMVNDKGQQVKIAPPSTPVQVLGLSGTPRAGDPMSVVENEARAREVAAYRTQLATAKRTGGGPASLESMFSALKEKQAEEYPLVVKADTQGSTEAIVGALNRLSTDDIRVRVLHAGTGGITESDVTLAGASGAPIIGFNVRPNAKAREIAERQKVALKYYDVIYDLIEDITAGMIGQLGPEFFETVVGRAEIRAVFPAGKTGRAAGLLVVEGVIKRDLRARITRDDVIIYNGKVSSLRRFKDDVAEVRAGLECGVTFDSHTDIKPGDFLETFEVEERERTL